MDVNVIHNDPDTPCDSISQKESSHFMEKMRGRPENAEIDEGNLEPFG
jgi:hypothetical protein